MAFAVHVVLVAPKIPANTGNIIRLCANTGAKLHLVAPIGFDLDDKKLRRAGLDYHEYARLHVHQSWSDTKLVLQDDGVLCMVALTTKMSRPFYDYPFERFAHAPMALIFGSETAGLPEDIRQDIGQEGWLRLPMLPDSRSLNLSNSVAVCLYELWRRCDFVGDVGCSVGYHHVSSMIPTNKHL